MPKSIIRTYSRYSHDAVELLGKLIRVARIHKKITLQEAADRLGVSRGMIQRIEIGNMKCEIGVVFEFAALVGVKLFDADDVELRKQIREINEKLVLLPHSVRNPPIESDDEF